MLAAVAGGEHINTGGGTMNAVWRLADRNVVTMGDDDYTVLIFTEQAWDNEDGMLASTEPWAVVYNDDYAEAVEYVRTLVQDGAA
jgi:hypothetical protein